LEYLIKVNIIAPDRDNLALQKVGAQADNLTEALEYGVKILNVIFERSHKHGRIIRIKRSAQNNPAAPKLM
jgi:hypothetical protein